MGCSTCQKYRAEAQGPCSDCVGDQHDRAPQVVTATVQSQQAVQVFDHTSIDSTEQLAQELKTSLEEGLCEDKAALAERAEAFGANKLPERDQVSWLSSCAW